MDTTTCPACGNPIQHGNGVQRGDKRLHWGCAIDASSRPVAEGETRLPNGTYV